MLSHSTDKWATILKVEFPKEQKIMEQWYQSPAYRENIELREKARNILSNMVAFGGKQMSKKSYEKDIWDRYLIHIEAAGFQTQDTEPYNYDFENKDFIPTYYRTLVFLFGTASSEWYYQFNTESISSHARSEYARGTDMAISDSSGHISIMGISETTNTDDTLRTAVFGTGWIPLSSVGENAQQSEMGEICTAGAIAAIDVNDVLSLNTDRTVEICVQPSRIASVTVGDYLAIMIMSWSAPETQGMQVLSYVKYILTKAPIGYLTRYLAAMDRQQEVDDEIEGPSTDILERYLSFNYDFTVSPYTKFFNKKAFNSTPFKREYHHSYSLEQSFQVFGNPRGTLEFYINVLASSNNEMLSNHLKKFGIDIDNLEEFDEMFDFTLKKMGDFNFEKPPLGEETFISDNPSDIIPDIIIVLLSGNMWHDKLFRNITRAFREYFLLPNIFPLPENQWEELHEIHRRYSDGQQFEPETTYEDYVESAETSKETIGPLGNTRYGDAGASA